LQKVVFEVAIVSPIEVVEIEVDKIVTKKGGLNCDPLKLS